MPNLIPSFSAYAPKPDLAGSAAAGANVAINIARTQAELQMSRERLTQQAQQASMEAQMSQMALAARAAQAQEENLIKKQEIAIGESYRKQQLGLEARDLERKEQMFQLEAQSAARQFQAQQAAAQRISRGEDPEQVWKEIGPMAGVNIPASAWSQDREMLQPEGMAVPGHPGTTAFRTGRGSLQYQHPPETTPALQPEAMAVPGHPSMTAFRTGRGSLQYQQSQAAMPENLKMSEVIGPDGQPVSGMGAVPGPQGRLNAVRLPAPTESAEVKSAKKELEALDSSHPWIKSGEVPKSKTVKAAAPAIKARYAELQKIITGGSAKPQAPSDQAAPAGTNSSGGFKIRRVVK